MSINQSLSALNMFGSITINARSGRLKFNTADGNLNGKITENEFRNVQLWYNCNGIEFSDIDTDGNMEIDNAEWSQMEAKADFQSVINSIQGTISSQFCKPDDVLIPEIVEELKTFIDNYVKNNNILAPNAKETFQTALEAKYNEIAESLNDRKPTVIVNNLLSMDKSGNFSNNAFCALLKNFETDGVGDMSHTHQQLLSDFLKNQQNLAGWVSDNYENYFDENGNFNLDQLKTDLIAYIKGLLTTETEGVSKWDEIKTNAKNKDKNDLSASVEELINAQNDCSASAIAGYKTKIGTLLNFISDSGNSEALSALVSTLNTANSQLDNFSDLSASITTAISTANNVLNSTDFTNMTSKQVEEALETAKAQVETVKRNVDNLYDTYDCVDTCEKEFKATMVQSYSAGDRAEIALKDYLNTPSESVNNALQAKSRISFIIHQMKTMLLLVGFSEEELDAVPTLDYDLYDSSIDNLISGNSADSLLKGCLSYELGKIIINVSAIAANTKAWLEEKSPEQKPTESGTTYTQADRPQLSQDIENELKTHYTEHNASYYGGYDKCVAASCNTFADAKDGARNWLANDYLAGIKTFMKSLYGDTAVENACAETYNFYNSLINTCTAPTADNDEVSIATYAIRFGFNTDNNKYYSAVDVTPIAKKFRDCLLDELCGVEETNDTKLKAATGAGTGTGTATATKGYCLLDELSGADETNDTNIDMFA